MARRPQRSAIERLDRITFDPAVMGGRACIRGLRVTVATLVDQMAEGASIDDVLADYPYLEREDIRQALSYAARMARDEVVPARGAMRFLVDANTLPAWRHGSVTRGTMPCTSFDLDMTADRDEQILARAAEESRILLTSDLDFGEIRSFACAAMPPRA